MKTRREFVKSTMLAMLAGCTTTSDGGKPLSVQGIRIGDPVGELPGGKCGAGISVLDGLQGQCAECHRAAQCAVVG